MGQLCSTASMNANLAQCQTLVRKAVAAGANVRLSSVHDSEFVLGLQKEAVQSNLHINVGIHEPSPDGRVKNTLIWINEKGIITQRYQKVHLFDVELKGGPVLKESAWVAPESII